MSSDHIEVLRSLRGRLGIDADGPFFPVGRGRSERVAVVDAALDAAIASLSAPKPESAEAVIPWVREWKGSGPQRGFHIREATRLHNNRVVAYLGDQVDGDEVDKLIAEHNGKHPNGDPVRPAPPRPEASAPVGVDEAAAFEAWARRQFKCAEAFDRIDGRPGGWEYNGDMVQAAWAAWQQRSCLAQQPAAVDGAMVERACAAALKEGGKGTHNSRRIMRAALTAALAGPQQGGES